MPIYDLAYYKQRLAEIVCENAQLKESVNRSIHMHMEANDAICKLQADLAAAQATIQRKDKAIQGAVVVLDRLRTSKETQFSHAIARDNATVHVHAAIESLKSTLALPADRSCLDAMLADAEKRGMLKAADKCFGRRWMVLQPLRTYTADECTRAQREAVESVGRELRQAAERSE